jgi:RNA polymerase I-specific transcription initiation factor RRN5
MDTNETRGEGDGHHIELEGEILTRHAESGSDGSRDSQGEQSAIIARPPVLLTTKWNRLRKYYSDQYLDLFRATFDGESHMNPDPELSATQMGAVLWQPDEKTNLYRALCRHGRHNLDKLASVIETKSPLEVKVYLDSLREQEADRQRFRAQPKNLSHAEIPAAVEIGPDCEEVLDRSADALLAFQEQYDLSAGQKAEIGRPWLIDDLVAREIDRETDHAEAEHQEEISVTEGNNDISERALAFFRLSTFLELSENLFMHNASDSLESWQEVAEEGQRPAMLLESITFLYDLIVNFLRRVLQSSLFLAESRLRATGRAGYHAKKVIKHEDVEAAVDILGLRRSLNRYWISLARKNRWNVIDDSHRRGTDTSVVLSYDEVEDRLSRPSRSRSTSVRRGMLTEDERDPDNNSKDSKEYPRKATEQTMTEQQSVPASPTENDDAYNTQTDEDDTSSSSSTGSDLDDSVRHLRQERLQLLEDQQDEYLERMDQVARQQEEAELLSLLGAEEAQKVKVEGLDNLGSRPPRRRKTVEDCAGWSVAYVGEWEAHPKRRKLDVRE